MRPPKSHFPSSTLPASPSSSGGRPRTGFTLIELLLSTVLGGIVIGAAVFIFANMAGSFSERDSDVDFPWTTSHAKVPQAPAYSQMESALNLQMAIMDLLQASNGGLTQSASAVFVVGGRDEAAPGGGCLNDFPDPLAAPVLSTAIGGAEAELMTSPTAFRTHITTAPDVTLSTEAIEDSFSIYIMNTPATIGAAIHCRRIDTANGMTVYSVYFYNSQGFQTNLSYSYALSTADANAALVRPGATHYWLRQNADWAINDHVGTQVVFPDPTSLPYEVTGGGHSLAFSRFVLFLPTRL